MFMICIYVHISWRGLVCVSLYVGVYSAHWTGNTNVASYSLGIHEDSGRDA